MNRRNPQDEIQVNNYVTAFLDLLGLSSRLLQFDAQHEAGEDAKRVGTVRVLRDIVDFRSVFLQFYPHFLQGEAREPPEPLPPEERERWDRMFPAMQPILQHFTDCVLVSVQIEEDRPVAVYPALVGLLTGCALSSLRMLLGGTSVRGGISFGYGAQIAAGEVVGSCLVRAYEIEKTDAIYPRIVVDPEFIAQIRPPTNPPQGWTEDDLSVAAGQWELCEGFLTTDQDGNYFIHFLGPATLNLFRHSYGEELAQESVTQLDNVIAENGGATSLEGASHQERKQRAKWCWLHQYWNQCRPRWPHRDGENV